jgi:hypothetical protein
MDDTQSLSHARWEFKHQLCRYRNTTARHCMAGYVSTWAKCCMVWLGRRSARYWKGISLMKVVPPSVARRSAQTRRFWGANPDSNILFSRTLSER